MRGGGGGGGGEGGGGARGRHLYRSGSFARKCISTTVKKGAPIYIWSRAAIPPAPPPIGGHLHHLTAASLYKLYECFGLFLLQSCS